MKKDMSGNDNISSISNDGTGMSGRNDIKEAPFWLVWSESENPTTEHYKKDEAMIEAGRLSKKYIDVPFFVAEVQFGYISHAETTKIHLVEESI